MTRTGRLVAALLLAFTLTVGLAWALLQPNPRDCGPGRSYSYIYRRCVGNLECDFPGACHPPEDR